MITKDKLTSKGALDTEIMQPFGQVAYQVKVCLYTNRKENSQHLVDVYKVGANSSFGKLRIIKITLGHISGSLWLRCFPKIWAKF